MCEVACHRVHRAVAQDTMQSPAIPESLSKGYRLVPLLELSNLIAWLPKGVALTMAPRPTADTRTHGMLCLSFFASMDLREQSEMCVQAKEQFDCSAGIACLPNSCLLHVNAACLQLLQARLLHLSPAGVRVYRSNVVTILCAPAQLRAATRCDHAYFRSSCSTLHHRRLSSSQVTRGMRIRGRSPLWLGRLLSPQP